MKINGQALPSIKPIEIVIPRGTEPPIVLVAGCVRDFKARDQFLQEPKPVPYVKNGVSGVDTSSSDYLAKLTKYNDQCWNWLLIESLKSTPGVSWSTYKPENPETWNFAAEMEAGGFNGPETNKIIQTIMEANSLNEEKFEEARKSFLASRG